MTPETKEKLKQVATDLEAQIKSRQWFEAEVRSLQRKVGTLNWHIKVLEKKKDMKEEGVKDE